MLIVPLAPPVAVPGGGGFDYVTVDAVHRRVYAAHGGAKSLAIVNADTGKVIGQVKVGPMAGVAVDPANGHVYTGDGDDKALSEVDPVTLKEVHRVSVDGPVDAIQYDATLHRIYGDEDDGTRIFVIDTRTFKQVGTVALPGHKPEFLQIDPQTHDIYQNIASDSEIVVIDPKTLKVKKTIKTPEIKNNHPLQLDAANHTLMVAGENGKLSVYSTSGKLLHTVAYPGRVDQCDYSASLGWLACSGGGVTLYKLNGTTPVLAGQRAVSKGMHTLAIDSKTGHIFGVYGKRDSATGSFVQAFSVKP